MEANRRFDIGERFLIGVTFTDSLEAKRIGYIAVRMLLNYYFELFRRATLLLSGNGAQHSALCHVRGTWGKRSAQPALDGIDPTDRHS